MSADKKFEALLSQFRDSKLAQIRGIRGADEQATEKGAWGYIRAAKALLGSQGGIEAFSELLTDKNREVRAAAAAYLLPHKTEQALEVLREVSRGKDLTALAALMSLRRWETGDEFPLPPFPDDSA
jgi:HEAT repeat protein